MTWHLRVLEIPDGASCYYEIREVYYNEHGKPWGHSKATMQGESKEALRNYLTWALEAIDKPAFQDCDLVERNANDPEVH